MNTNRLYRIASQSAIGGVAAGLAQYLGISRAVVRIMMILLGIYTAFFPVFLVYVILWIALPKIENSQVVHSNITTI